MSKYQKIRPTLKKAAYDNLRIVDISGGFLSFVPQKRADWYVNKRLADWVSEDTIQLNFSLNHMIAPLTQFEATPKGNRCVVCGSEEGLTKHHVIPRMFRRTRLLKTDRCHDVLATCASCHDTYETLADRLKSSICAKHNLSNKGNQTLIELACNRNKILGARNTLKKYGDKIPLERKAILEEIASRSLPDKPKFTRRNEVVYNWVQSLDYTQSRELILRWRRHFVDTMQPRFLPAGWAVDYEHIRVKDDEL